MGKSRLESFSDGVIAVSLTLMLAQIHLPSEFTWAALWRETHNFPGYVLSFIYVGIYWNNHHHLFQVVSGINGWVMWANLNLLFWLTMIPLATAWAERSDFLEVPTALYAFALFMCSVSYWLLERAIIAAEGRAALLANTLGKDLKGKVSLLIYALAVACSFYSTTATFSILAGMAMLWFVPDSRIERHISG